jgi:hypothetical protein
MKDSVEPALLLLEAGANPRQSRYGEPGSGLVLKQAVGLSGRAGCVSARADASDGGRSASRAAP